MSRTSKVLVQACFLIWLANSILPGVLAQYTALVPIFVVGRYISYAVGGLAFATLIIPILTPKKQVEQSKAEGRLILHDLDPETAHELFADMPNTKFFCAAKKMVACKGDYGCWLKTPGICIFHDGVEELGKEIALCDEFIIISKSLYGGFDKEIKTALDRSISFILPFFQVRNKEQHHQARYINGEKMRVYIYDANEISETDKALITEVAKANSINMNKSEPDVHFVQDVVSLKGSVI